MHVNNTLMFIYFLFTYDYDVLHFDYIVLLMFCHLLSYSIASNESRGL